MTCELLIRKTLFQAVFMTAFLGAAALTEGCGDRSGESDEDTDLDQVADMECYQDSDCSNGLVCDGDEQCVDGACRDGDPPSCTDDDPCTMDYCSEDEGGCVHEALDEDHDGFMAGEAPDGTPCGGTDCDDGNPDIYPGAPKQCYGSEDYNCNDIIDGEEDYERLGDPVMLDGISDLPGYSSMPSLVYTGTEVGITWNNAANFSDFDVYFGRLAADGTRIGDDIILTNNPVVSPKSLAWTGTEFAVAWDGWQEAIADNFEIYFARISADGLRRGGDVRLSYTSGDSTDPALSWNGTEFGMVWNDYDFDTERCTLLFSRISADGTKMGEDVRIVDGESYSYFPAITWTGTNYGIVWSDERSGSNDIFFCALSDEGSLEIPETRVNDISGDCREPSIVWTGTEYGISYIVGDDIYFIRLSDAGMNPGDLVRITYGGNASSFPCLAWTGTEYGLVWQDFREGPAAVYFARIAAGGTRLGSDLKINEGSFEAKEPFLVWTDSAFSVVWSEGEYGEEKTYYARIGCE